MFPIVSDIITNFIKVSWETIWLLLPSFLDLGIHPASNQSISPSEGRGAE